MRITYASHVAVGKKHYEFSGISTETKPIDSSVATGSLFHCVDTTEVYAFDETTSTWYLQMKLGGEE